MLDTDVQVYDCDTGDPVPADHIILEKGTWECWHNDYSDPEDGFYINAPKGYINVACDIDRLVEEWKEKGLLHRIEVLRRKKEARTGEPTSMSSLIWDMIDDVLDLWEEDEEQRERYPEEYEEGD